MSFQFYKSSHGTIHVADNPHKMSCGRVLKQGEAIGKKVHGGELGVFGGRVHIKGYYVCDSCRKRIKDCRLEKYWIEVDVSKP